MPKNKREMDEPVIARLGTETRMLLRRHGTVKSKKVYNRKGKNFKKYMDEVTAEEQGHLSD